MLLRVLQGDGWRREQLGKHLSRRARSVRQASGEKEVCDGRKAVLIGRCGDQLTGERFGRDVHQSPDKKTGSRQTLVGGSFGIRRDSKIQ